MSLVYVIILPQAATGNNASVIASTRRPSTEESVSSESAEPLPKHVALEMEAMSLAQRQSMMEAQKQKNEAIKLRKQNRLEMKKALEESRAESAVYNQCREDEEAELQKVLALSAKETAQTISDAEIDHLKFAIEQSLLDEQEREKQQAAMYEDELNKIIEQSTKEKPNEEELELLKILELSLKDNEAEHMSEEEELQRAIELSQQSHDLQTSDDIEVHQLSAEENYIVDQQQVQIKVTDAAWFYVDPQDKVQVSGVTLMHAYQSYSAQLDTLVN